MLGTLHIPTRHRLISVTEALLLIRCPTIYIFTRNIITVVLGPERRAAKLRDTRFCHTGADTRFLPVPTRTGTYRNTNDSYGSVHSGHKRPPASHTQLLLRPRPPMADRFDDATQVRAPSFSTWNSNTDTLVHAAAERAPDFP
jgi:hypothetical protein